MRAIVALGICLAVGGRAAVAGGTAVLPIDSDGMGSAAAKLNRDVTIVVTEILKGGYHGIDVGNVPGGARVCSQSPACLSQIALDVDADEVVFISASRLAGDEAFDHWATLTLQIFNRAGEPAMSLQQAIGNLSGILDLRGLVVQAFDPAQYQGRLQLLGVVDGDEVLIDGLALDGHNDSALRAGPHQARLRRAGQTQGNDVNVAFVIPFAGLKVLDFAAVTTTIPGGMPLQVPAWVHGSAAAASGALAMGVGVRELLIRRDAKFLEHSRCPQGSADPSGANFQNQGVSALGACTALQIEFHQGAQLNRELNVTLGVSMMAVAAAATAAWAVAGFTPPASE